jgi:hypothetical protein
MEIKNMAKVIPQVTEMSKNFLMSSAGTTGRHLGKDKIRHILLTIYKNKLKERRQNRDQVTASSILCPGHTLLKNSYT